MTVNTLEKMIHSSAFDYVIVLSDGGYVFTFEQFQNMSINLSGFPPYWVINATVRGNVLILGK